MRLATIALAVPLMFAGCTPTPQQVATLTAFCKTDAQLQPIVVTLGAPVIQTVIPTAAPALQGFIALDTTLIHPAIVAACAGVGGTAVGVAGSVVKP